MKTKGHLVIEDRVKNQTGGKQERFMDCARSHYRQGHEPGETLRTVQLQMVFSFVLALVPSR